MQYTLVAYDFYKSSKKKNIMFLFSDLLDMY